MLFQVLNSNQDSRISKFHSTFFSLTTSIYTLNWVQTEGGYYFFKKDRVGTNFATAMWDMEKNVFLGPKFPKFSAKTFKGGTICLFWLSRP